MTSAKSKFDNVHRAGIKQQETDLLSPLKTKGEEPTSLDDEVIVLTISQKVFDCEPVMETPELQLIKEPNESFVPFIPEVYLMGGITGSEKAELQTLN